MTRPIKVAVIGGGRSARLLAQAVLAAGVQVVSVDERRMAQAQMHGLKLPSEPKPSPWDTGSRTRAQWKDETNKRGRNR